MKIFRKTQSISFLVIITSFLIFYKIYSFKFIHLSPNEVMYIGMTFKTDSIYSSYFGYQDNFGQYFFYEQFVEFFVYFFPQHFYVLINIFISALYLFSFFKLFKIFNINQLLLPLFSFIFFTEKFYANFGALNFVEQGIAEPRHLGWVLILISISYFFEKKYLLSLVVLSLTTYFYFVIVLLLSPIFLFLFMKFKLNLKFLFSFVLINLPYFLFLYSSNATSDSLDDALYTYIVKRHPHHLYPFENGLLRPEWFESFKIILIFTLVTILLIYFLKKISIEKSKNLILLTILTFVLLLIYLVLTYIFPINKFVLLMPIRLYNLIYIFILLGLFLILSELTETKIKLLLFNLFLVFTIISNPIFSDFYSLINGNYSAQVQVIEVKNDNKKIIQLNDIDAEFLELISFLNSSVPNEGIILINNENYLSTSIEITTGISTYVLDKIVPKSLKNIYEWSERKILKAKTIETCANFLNIKTEIYVVSDYIPEVNLCKDVVFINDDYVVYRIK